MIINQIPLRSSIVEKTEWAAHTGGGVGRRGDKGVRRRRG